MHSHFPKLFKYEITGHNCPSKSTKNRFFAPTRMKKLKKIIVK